MVDSINNPFRQMKGYCQIDGGETFYGGGSVAENSKLSDVEKLKNKSVWTLEDRKQAERCLNEIDFSTRASDNDTEEAKAAFELWGRMKTETTKLTGSKALDAVNEALASEEPVPEVKLTESEEVSAAEDEEPEDEVDDEEGSVIYDVAEYSDKNARPFAPVQYVTEEVPVSVDDSNEEEEVIEHVDPLQYPFVGPRNHTYFETLKNESIRKTNPWSGQFLTVVKDKEGRYKSIPSRGFEPTSEDASFSLTKEELQNKAEKESKVDGLEVFRNTFKL